MPSTAPYTADSPSDRQSLWTLAILSMLMAFASISTDLYLPALPAMADGTPRPMAAVLLIFGIASLPCARWLVPTQHSVIPQELA